MSVSRKKIRSDQIIEAVVTLLLVLAVLLCILCVMQVGSKGYVQLFGYSFFRVVTGSMEPTLPVGTLLITQQVDIASVELEDIVCFHSKDSAMLGLVITHRVMDIKETADGSIHLLTKGDANLAADGYYVTGDNLIGQVIWNSEEGGMASAVMSILNSQVGFLICIIFPVLLIGSFILRSTIRSLQEGIDEVIAELEPKETPVEISKEEYMEIYERVKQELLRELANGEIKYESIPESQEGSGQKPEAQSI